MLTAVFLATVIGISDGDTLTVLKPNKQQVKIRLAGIEAPERRQPFGMLSKQSLSDLCFGAEAEVRPQAKDRYRRVVAQVKCDGIDANAAQVHGGMAWVYRKYAKDQSLYILQHDAWIERRGLWSDPSPIPPWEFRNYRRKDVRTFEQDETRWYYARGWAPEQSTAGIGGEMVWQNCYKPKIL